MSLITPWTYKMTGIELECTMDTLRRIVNSYRGIAMDSDDNSITDDEIYEELKNIEFRIMNEKEKTMKDWENEINKVSAKLAEKYNIRKFQF